MATLSLFHGRVLVKSHSNIPGMLTTKYMYIVVKNNTSSTLFTTADDQSHSKNNHSSIHDFRVMSSMCPGAAEYLSEAAEPAIFHVSVSDCRRPGYDPRSQHGVVFGMCNDSTTFCQFFVQGRPGMTVRVVKPSSQASENIHAQKLSLSTSNQTLITQYYSPTRQIQVEAVMHKLNKSLHILDVGGYVMLLPPKDWRHTRDKLHVQVGHAIMVSFEAFIRVNYCFRNVQLLWREQNKHWKEHKQNVRSDNGRPVYILYTNILEILTFPSYTTRTDVEQFCVKLHFTFHPEATVPNKINTGLYNCTVADYWRFQRHLDCNMKVECEDGRDETEHCPFSSPACGGWVASRLKCYKLFINKKNTGVSEAIDQCRKRGSLVASIKTKRELVDFQKIFQGSDTMIALRVGQSGIPFMYRFIHIWLDNTIAYKMDFVVPGVFEFNRKSSYHYMKRNMMANQFRSLYANVPHVACEKPVKSNEVLHNQSVQFSATRHMLESLRHTRQSLVDCPEGHVTHAFLSCDPKSRCGQTTCDFASRSADYKVGLFVKQNPERSKAMFTCTSFNMIIHYTLLCDFRQDCRDGSDESFCQHPLCDAFTCNNGQCISSDKRCNEKSNCLDDTDESGCRSILYIPRAKMQRQRQRQQFLINLDGEGYFTYRTMNASETCPETHYLCRIERLYCLPIYTRCNGFSDCIYGEDERNCESITCPYLYNCRDSTICVHADHMCDGWPQCPQHDDEWLCDMTCPAQCLCQGHAFLCPQPFPAHLFPQLRYLDARGSRMKPSVLNNKTYLVNLNLAYCFISFLSDMEFPNLKFLDLSNNKLTNITMNIFLPLGNLQSLSFQGNPLTSIVSGTSHLKQHALQRLDLSRTCLGMFDSQTIRQFLGLQYMNVSYAALQSVGPGGFKSAPSLKELDVRGNTIDTFPTDVFDGVTKIAIVLSSNYRLCCKDVLSAATKCIAPQYFLHSCEHMIESNINRFTFWFVAIVSVLGNLICVAGHYSLKKLQFGNNAIACMASLQCSNFCTGLYTGVIVSADSMFSGRFFHHEDEWKDSVACKVAGFMSLMSSQVSIFTIFFLTLDHLIVLCFPHSKYRLSRRSATVACGSVWFAGFLLACMPLLPDLSHLGRYDRTALCNVMARDKLHFNKEFQFFYATVTLNCIICLIVSAVEVFVYRAIPKQWLLINPNRNPAYVSAELVLKLATTNVVVWLSVTATSVLSLASGAETEETNVTMAVMVLPLSSAVNPLLYLWHVVAFNLRKKQEERLLCVLKSRAKYVLNRPSLQTTGTLAHLGVNV